VRVTPAAVSGSAASPTLPAVTRLLRRTAMGAVLGKEPLEHKRDAVAQHRVVMPRKPQHHDLKRSRHDELTDTQQKDAQVSSLLAESVQRALGPTWSWRGRGGCAVARRARLQVDGGDRTASCCPRTVSHMLQVVQRMLVAAAAAQLLWHFAIGPWWDKRRRRGNDNYPTA
jgi:hypothetical protein